MANKPFIANEPRTDLVPIRQAYFGRDFWLRWDRMSEQDRAAYLLGWSLELELAVRRCGESVERIEERVTQLEERP